MCIYMRCTLPYREVTSIQSNYDFENGNFMPSMHTKQLLLLYPFNTFPLRVLESQDKGVDDLVLLAFRKKLNGMSHLHLCCRAGRHSV